MKINLKALISIFIILITFTHASERKFKVSYDPDYAPFSYLNKNIPEGLLIDYWKLWAEKNNYELEFVNGKLWDDAINLVKDGKVDFFLGTYPYEKWMLGSMDIYETQTSLFMHKGNKNKDFNTKSPYIIGIIGSDYKEHMKENFPNSEIIIYEDYNSIFKDFNSKKIDLIYEDKIAIEFYALRSNFFHKIHSIELLNDKPQFQAIAKDKQLIEIFNKGFKKLTYNELYNIETKWIIDKRSRYYENKKTLLLTKEEKDFLQKTKINVSVSKGWRPFTFQSNINKPIGISSEIWKLIASKARITSEYTFYDDFTEQLESIKNKKQDIIFSTGKTKDREQYSLFTEPYVNFPISIVTLKDENFIENITYIKDKKIAVGENFTAHKMLKESYPKLNLVLVKSIKDGLQSVLDKKAFAYIDIKPNLTYNINKFGLEDLKVTGNTGLNFELRMMIRDDYEILHSILNKTISSMDQEDIKTVINRWNNIQFENTFNYEKLWMVLIVIALIFFALLYLNQLNLKRNKVLKQKVDERTSELVRLNELLELKVEEKTRQLKRSNYLLDEAQKIAHLGSFQYHIKRKELIWSDEHFKIFGLYPNEIEPSKKMLLSFIHQDDKAYVESQIEKIKKSDKTIITEFRIILKDKTIKYIQSTSKVTKFDIDSKPILVVGTILDLTKLKKLEIEKRENDSILAQQSKMAAMGEMLENIAHQWRQPLSVISTASTGMQIQLEMQNDIPRDILLENIKSINEHAQYLSKTIDDFRNFFSPNKTKIVFDVEKSIEKAIYLINSRLNSLDIEVIKDIEKSEIYALESELIQVLLNILNNAIDALENQKASKKYILINVYKERYTLHIEIKDTAMGIQKNIIDRVFEPYFTTKHKSQGTGIGLYMSSQIITKHLYGSIDVENSHFEYKKKEYTGALFKIALPLSNKKDL